MARYNRDFLVPYLHDLCALHLLKEKLNTMIVKSNNEMREINKNAVNKVTPPQLETLKNDADWNFGSGCLGILLMFGSVIAFFAGLFDAKSAGIFVAAALLFAIGLTMTIWGKNAPERENREIQERNDRRERDYAAEQMAALIIVEPKVKAVKERIATYENEICKIEALLQDLYSINVIPGWYREKYPAVYLYDWFSNSRADDLDLALNALILEQIKDKLDRIIINQGEMIINQRIMIANQETAMEQNQRNYNALMAKLDKIEGDNEERNIYLSMIERNSAANAYFSAATYLRYM